VADTGRYDRLRTEANHAWYCDNGGARNAGTIEPLAKLPSIKCCAAPLPSAGPFFCSL